MYSEKNELLFEIEKWFIEKYAPSEGNAIDIGAGTGTYSVEVVRHGCDITLIDISEEQLEKAVDFISTSGMSDKIRESKVCDGANLVHFNDCSFDFVICYGMINFSLHNDIRILNEIYRVLKPGSIVLISAMSVFGYISNSWKQNSNKKKFSIEHDYAALKTGLITSVSPYRNLYTSEELIHLVERTGLDIIEVASAPSLGNFLQKDLSSYKKNNSLWNQIISMEKELCTIEGLRDMGTNIIIAAKKLSD